MKVGLIDIQQTDFAAAHAFIKRLKLFHEASTFLCVCFGQELFALFPTEPSRFQQGAQRVAADGSSQFRFDPVLELFQAPAMTRKRMFDGLTALDRFAYLCPLALVKKGVRPPLCW